MIQHIKKFFLAIIVLACFTCFQRADYNLPLFAFAYFLWDYKHPNVPLPSFSCRKLGCSTCSWWPGSLISSGWYTGESPGAPASTRLRAQLVPLPSYWSSPSSSSSQRYFLPHPVGNYHHLLHFRPGMQNNHKKLKLKHLWVKKQ